MSDLKLEKEEFVSGLGGTTVAEINLITSTLIAGFFLRCCILICIPSSLRQVISNLPLSFLLEYATIILPGILTLTILADYAVYILVTELLTSAVLILMKLKTLRHFSFKSLSSAFSSPYPHHRHPYITLTRTFINVFTAIAILAVDFSIFPRRLAKTEIYGSGLMDLGVGVFLMSHGLTSPEARHHEPPNSRGGGVGLVGYLRLVGRTVRGVLPLFLLGMARLLVVKYTGYQEHITEYGVHWNFFFTIATVRVSFKIHSKNLNSNFFFTQNCFPPKLDLMFFAPPITSKSPIWWSRCRFHRHLYPLPSHASVGWIRVLSRPWSPRRWFQNRISECQQRRNSLVCWIHSPVHGMGRTREVAVQAKVIIKTQMSRPLV